MSPLFPGGFIRRRGTAIAFVGGHTVAKNTRSMPFTVASIR